MIYKHIKLKQLHTHARLVFLLVVVLGIWLFPFKDHHAVPKTIPRLLHTYELVVVLMENRVSIARPGPMFVVAAVVVSAVIERLVLL
jgi:hypothetical protein